MMKAVVTAENKPACDPSEYMQTWGTHGTHKYEGHVQVFVIFLDEVPIVLFSLHVIVIIEPTPMILLSGQCILFSAA